MAAFLREFPWDLDLGGSEAVLVVRVKQGIIRVNCVWYQFDMGIELQLQLVGCQLTHLIRIPSLCWWPSRIHFMTYDVSKSCYAQAGMKQNGLLSR